MKKVLKNIFSYSYPLLSFFKKRQKHYNVKVFILHDIKENQWEKAVKFIDWLEKNYQIISPLEFTNYLKGRFHLERQGAVLSFDDGMVSSYKLAVDVLAQKGIKAYFFICPSYIDLDDREAKHFCSQKIFRGNIVMDDVTDGMLPMTKEQVLELAICGHEIGGHSMEHLDLGKKNESLVEHEVAECAKWLSTNIPQGPFAFAWPFGSLECIAPQSIKIINHYFDQCHSGIRGNNSEKSGPIVWRDAIDLADPMPLIKFSALGGLNPMYQRSRKKLRSYL